MDPLTLLRIEHKLDMIIRSMQSGIMLPSPLPSLQDSDQDTCPVCEQIYRWTVNIPKESVSRVCGCKAKTSLVPGIADLLNSPVEKESSNGRQERNSRTTDGGSSQRSEG